MGVILSARSFVPLFLSIHGGSLMDQLGVRRALLVLAILNGLLPWLYPVFPFVIAVLILELIGGLVSSMAWIGAQTALARVAQGDPKSAGRFSFSTNMGNLAGPILVGFFWKIGGPIAGFGIISLWGFLLLAAVYYLPVGDRPREAIGSWKSLMPKWSVYKKAFVMLKMPGVDLVVFATFLRIAAYSIQASFYAVALAHLGQDEFNTGILMGVAGLSSGLATLLGAPASRFLGSQVVVLIGGIATAIIAISMTPYLSGFSVLFSVALIFGLGMGISLPLLLSVLSSTIPREQQGLSVGLRSTANRLAGVVVPIGLGVVIEFMGIAQGFMVIGLTLLLVLMIGGLLLFRRAKRVSGINI
jgi:MFS family permease